MRKRERSSNRSRQDNGAIHKYSNLKALVIFYWVKNVFCLHKRERFWLMYRFFLLCCFAGFHICKMQCLHIQVYCISLSLNLALTVKPAEWLRCILGRCGYPELQDSHFNFRQAALLVHQDENRDIIPFWSGNSATSLSPHWTAAPWGLAELAEWNQVLEMLSSNWLSPLRTNEEWQTSGESIFVKRIWGSFLHRGIAKLGISARIKGTQPSQLSVNWIVNENVLKLSSSISDNN